MQKKKLGLAAGAVLSASLLISSVWAGYGEAGPFLFGGTTIDGKISALAADRLHPGLSYRSKMLVLDDCSQSLFNAAIAAEADRTALATNCRTIAQDIVASDPTFSFAWLVIAMAAAQENDAEVMRQALVQSQHASPYEEWLTFARVMLAYDHLDSLPQDALDSFAQDLRITIQSARGVAWAAQRYVLDVGRRTLLTTIIEGAEPQYQRRFLAAVQREQAGAQS